MNKIMISGAVNTIYDMKVTQNKTECINIVIASYNDSSRKSFTLIECALWGQLANQFYNSISKGDYIFIEGRLAKNSYKDNNGKTVYKTYVYATNYELVTPSTSEVEERKSLNEESTNRFIYKGTDKEKTETNDNYNNYNNVDEDNNLTYDDDNLPF